MEISNEAILERINSEFATIYRPFSRFVNSGTIWDKCIDTINDTKLMNNLIFCNDVLQIPPVKVFLKANALDLPFTNFEKKAIGAFWGFVFKFAFNYRSQMDDTPINTYGVKKAAYFYDPDSKVEVL